MEISDSSRMPRPEHQLLLAIIAFAAVGALWPRMDWSRNLHPPPHSRAGCPDHPGRRWCGLASPQCRERDGVAGERRVAGDELAIRAQRWATARAMEVVEHERRDVLTADAALLCQRERLLDQGLCVVEALVGRAGEHDRRRAPEVQWAIAIAAASLTSSTRAETGGPPRAA